MRLCSFFVAIPSLLALSWVASAADADRPGEKQQESETGFVSLFDGKSFAQWEGDTVNTFRIEKDAIVGGSLKTKVPRNEFLTSRKEYDDFELRLEFKLLGKGANAGIQLRSRRIPNHHEMVGYQADLGEGYWGALYDESRRNKVLAAPKKDALAKVLKPDDWNEYRMVCRGKQIQLFVNGFPTVDYTEPDASLEQRGKLGLQIHGGGPSEVSYRNIRIKEFH